MQHTKNLPKYKEILNAWQLLIKKKWASLHTKYEQYIRLLHQEGISNILVHNRLTARNNLVTKEAIQKPLKQYQKKEIFLSNLLKPLNESLKQILLKNGIEKQYLDFIYLTNRADIIKFDEFHLISEPLSAAHYTLILENNDHYQQDKLIIIENDFLKYVTQQELIFILNHEIQHTLHKQSIQEFLMTKELILEEKGYKPFPISKKFKEFDADVIGILKTGKINIKTAIETLLFLKAFNYNYPDQSYPKQRYEYSVEIIKSMITGELPSEIPDAWLDNTEHILDQEIKRLEFKKQNSSITQAPPAKM